jgi:hypothetical protein
VATKITEAPELGSEDAGRAKFVNRVVERCIIHMVEPSTHVPDTFGERAPAVPSRLSASASALGSLATKAYLGNPLC